MNLPSPSPTVVFQSLEDGAMLFYPESETYFGLNAVGALVWCALPPAHGTLDALCATLGERFPDVPRDTIRTDVIELLDALLREGLVQPTPTGDGDAAPTP
ncbi:MAG: PqqD family protein [Gemmatimonadetes bacterium]|nr:PqqD family protein [Gemmatimonadota bacterium]